MKNRNANMELSIRYGENALHMNKEAEFWRGLIEYDTMVLEKNITNINADPDRVAARVEMIETAKIMLENCLEAAKAYAQIAYEKEGRGFKAQRIAG